ncbi:MAG: hypothetical protein ACK55Z_17775 [bacterium]
MQTSLHVRRIKGKIHLRLAYPTVPAMHTPPEYCQHMRSALSHTTIQVSTQL